MHMWGRVLHDNPVHFRQQRAGLKTSKIYVVVNFLISGHSVFLLFWGMLICMLMKLKQNKNQNYLRLTVNYKSQ